MKKAVIGDIHLSKYSQDKIEDESNLPERLHSIKKALYEVADYCIANDIKVIEIVGDTLHGKSIIYAIAQNLMLSYFNHYKDDITFIVIDGNHDLAGKGSNVVSALRPLENISNVHWIDHTQIYKENNEIHIPYSYDMFNKIKTNKAQILYSHFGLSEATLNSGMSIISDVSIRDLAGNYDLVILGHYHKPQEIIRSDIRIYYVGSLIQLDWGEKGDEKRFLIVDTDTLDVQSIPLTNYKKHIELDLNSDNVEEILKEAQIQKDAGNHVKVLMKEKVDLSGIKTDLNIIDKTEQDITDRGITSSMSQIDKFVKYLEIKDIPENQHESYLNIAKEISEESEL